MKQTLLEILTDTNTDDIEWSVSAHLALLLNTRQGSLTHLPDYGLPDLTEVYRDLPDSIIVLSESIKKCINQYEPRLSQVCVAAMKNSPNNALIQLSIKGVINTARTHYVTTFIPGEAAKIEGTYVDD